MPPDPNRVAHSHAHAPVMTRREVLRGGGAVAAGLLIGIDFGRAQAGPLPAGGRLNAFVHIGTDDQVTLTMPAVEMGQGVYTSQAMCLAEELDVGLDQVVPVHAPAGPGDYGNPALVIQATGGSTTTSAWLLPLRRAAATARMLLLQAAAAEWSAEATALTTSRGVITHSGSGRTLRYGQVAARAARLKAPAAVALKDPSQFRLIGTPAKRIDTGDKAVGKTVYGIDVMQPGMKFATLMASPVLGGKVSHVEQVAALAVPGVRQVVVLDDLVAVVGDHMWAALQGLRALSIEWTPGHNADLDQAQMWSELEEASVGAGVTGAARGQRAREAAGRLGLRDDLRVPVPRARDHGAHELYRPRP